VVLVVACFLAFGIWEAVGWAAAIRGPRVIAGGDVPSGLALARDGKTLYVAYYGSEVTGTTLVPVNVRTGKAGRPIRVGDSPTELAISSDGRTLYTLLDPSSVSGLDTGRVVSVDIASGAVRQLSSFPGGADDLRMSPDGRTLYVVSGNNQMVLSAFDADGGRREESVPLPDAPNAMAVAPSGGWVYLAFGDPADSRTDKILPVNVLSGKPGTPVPLKNNPVALALSPDGRTLYAIGNDNNFGSGTHSVTAVDTVNGRAASPLAVGPTPFGVTVAPDGRAVYVQAEGGSIFVLDARADRIESTLHVAGIFSTSDSYNDGLWSASSMVTSPATHTLYADNGRGVAVLPISS
jgi:hyaluronoglucosaminidase